MTFSMANMVGSPVGGYVLTQYCGVGRWGGCAAFSVLAWVLYLRVSRLQAEPG